MVEASFVAVLVFSAAAGGDAPLLVGSGRCPAFDKVVVVVAPVVRGAAFLPALEDLGKDGSIKHCRAGVERSTKMQMGESRPIKDGANRLHATVKQKFFVCLFFERNPPVALTLADNSRRCTFSLTLYMTLRSVGLLLPRLLFELLLRHSSSTPTYPLTTYVGLQDYSRFE